MALIWTPWQLGPPTSLARDQGTSEVCAGLGPIVDEIQAAGVVGEYAGDGIGMRAAVGRVAGIAGQQGVAEQDTAHQQARGVGWHAGKHGGHLIVRSETSDSDVWGRLGDLARYPRERMGLVGSGLFASIIAKAQRREDVGAVVRPAQGGTAV